MYKIENNRILLIEDEVIIGYVFFNKKDEFKVSIDQVFVNPDYRGKGIADKLLKYTVNYFESNNIKIEMVCSYAKKWLEKRN